MSDFEDKLRSLELRQPHSEWQREISKRCTFTEPASVWRQWLWPSPLAWAALAITWLGLVVADRLEKPPLAATASSKAPTVTSFVYQSRDIDSFWPLAANSPR